MKTRFSYSWKDYRCKVVFRKDVHRSPIDVDVTVKFINDLGSEFSGYYLGWGPIEHAKAKVFERFPNIRESQIQYVSYELKGDENF